MYATQTMTGQLKQSLWTRRAYSRLFRAFALIAILLAAASVYGVVSYTVSLHTHEIAGSGAARWDEARFVGVVAGLAGAFWATRLLRTLLFGVSSRDPLIYAAVVVGLIGVGLLGPSFRRAARLRWIRCGRCTSSESQGA